MDKQCPKYIQQIPPAILGEDSSQCQKTGGGNGAGHGRIETTTSVRFSTSATAIRESKSHIKKLVVATIPRSTLVLKKSHKNQKVARNEGDNRGMVGIVETYTHEKIPYSKNRTK